MPNTVQKRPLSKKRLTIENHLQKFNKQDGFKKLVNKWNNEKQGYIDELKTIINTYPDYSLHDESHSKKIIENIERLLGAERIALLSPTDAWLILQCAYTHDLGMAVTMKDKEKLFYEARHDKNKAKELYTQREFQKFINEIENNGFNAPDTRVHIDNNMLLKAIAFWNGYVNKADEIGFRLSTNPVGSLFL